ncbi:MAG: glycogen debranching protein GlgX [Sporichthyaceae bacterium]
MCLLGTLSGRRAPPSTGNRDHEHVTVYSRTAGPGRPAPLGVHHDPVAGGVNVAVHTGGADAVTVCLFDTDANEIGHVPLLERTGHIWHGFITGIEPGQRYGLRVDGAWDPARGARYNPSKLLLDPYARAITGEFRAHPVTFGHVHGGSDRTADDRDSAGEVPFAVVVPASTAPDWARPDTPWSDTVIYELHVRGFTREHPAVPPPQQGTYAGLAHPAVTGYLRDLGVTAVDLLPVHHFVSEEHLLRGGRRNYWGYNTLGYFAPHAGYSSCGSTGGQVSEFRAMVRALHDAGLEVLLDVVYNHSAEGGLHGPTLSFRGLDNATYYRRRTDAGYDDVTGCGNTLDTRHAHVLRLVMDSMRYWVTEMGVDGFRFDLAPALLRGEATVDFRSALLAAIGQDPVLCTVKLIAEPWDLGLGGYVLGGFPAPWAEWNDRFRGGVRDFWRGAAPGVNDLAYRLSGSSDLFGYPGRAPAASVNFVTAHDGFTLRDLVTYETKRNDDNGEDNRDGTQDNRSWNCGVEGESDDGVVAALRERQLRNLLMTLLLSVGTPMLVAGDERGRTQRGNNNAYCQDNEISYLDWSPGQLAERLTAFTRELLRLRAGAQELRRTEFFTGAASGAHGAADITWVSTAGTEMTEADWHDVELRTLGMLLAASADHHRHAAPPRAGYLLLLHAGAEPIKVSLPANGEARRFVTELASELPTPGAPEPGPWAGGDALTLSAHSALLLRIELTGAAADLQR